MAFLLGLTAIGLAGDSPDSDSPRTSAPMTTTEQAAAPSAAVLTWSKAATHCAWCDRPNATPVDWDRHRADFDDPGKDCEDVPDSWCLALCWTACVDYYSPVTLLAELRARLEVAGELYARFRDGWVEHHTRGEPNGYWWHPSWEVDDEMTDAQQLVLYGRIVARPRRRRISRRRTG